MIYILNESEDPGQHSPYAIPFQCMQCYSYHRILVEMAFLIMTIVALTSVYLWPVSLYEDLYARSSSHQQQVAKINSFAAGSCSIIFKFVAFKYFCVGGVLDSFCKIALS